MKLHCQETISNIPIIHSYYFVFSNNYFSCRLVFITFSLYMPSLFYCSYFIFINHSDSLQAHMDNLYLCSASLPRFALSACCLGPFHAAGPSPSRSAAPAPRPPHHGTALPPPAASSDHGSRTRTPFAAGGPSVTAFVS